VFAQDEATSALYGMPREAVAQGVVDAVLPLDQMAGSIVAACNAVAHR
jgi:two-component system chemotaxis response regulator CheB